jgi:uncharacterized protein YjbJ (UPF0337 family)
MNWDEIEGKWTELRGTVRKKWGKLTDDDLARIKGSREQLAGVLQQRYGFMKEEAEREIDAFSRQCGHH